MAEWSWSAAVQALAGLWAAVEGAAGWKLATAVALGLAAFIPVAEGVAWCLEKLAARRAAAVAAAIRSTTNVQSFADEEIQDAVRHYVEPDCSSVDPANDSDIRHFVGVREPVFATIDRALSTEGRHHLMVLADSGMGKTTLLLNYFAREQRRKAGVRRPMAVVPLGRPNALEQIRAVQDKRATYLLLDALDEDTHAIHDHRARLDDLMSAAADFKSVVLTCRTQFFSSDDAIPRETGIARVAPRRAGKSAMHEFKRLYLLPFTQAQVQRFVQKTVPWWRPVQRRRAVAVVRKIPELSVRPMLLAMLPELMATRVDMTELWQLYEFMVDSWLRRESSWIDPRQLERVSVHIAVDIGLHREARGSDRLTPEELTHLLNLAPDDIERWKLTTRSLLNRDSEGNFKFAHRSIMEFAFIKAFIDGRSECASIPWTDMMCDLFLSWGRVASTVEDIERLDRALVRTDLTPTKLFPIIRLGETASSIDASWAKASLRETGTARERAGIPAAWRSRTSRYRAVGDLVTVYEFAEGIVWAFPDTRAIEERAERDVLKDYRHDRQGIDRQGSWQAPTLSEFRSLVESLYSHNRLTLDSRELYWLADEDSSTVAVARVRWGEQGDAVQDFPGGITLLYSAVSSTSRHPGYTIDVYKVPRLQVSRELGVGMPAARALRIRTTRCDAQDLWRQQVPAEMATRRVVDAAPTSVGPTRVISEPKE